MSLTLITAPTNPVVTLAQIKAHARVTHAHEDDLLQQMVAAAVSHLDGYGGVLGMCLALQTWELTYDAFPDGAMRVPLEPVTAISSVTYLDAVGVAQMLAPAGYEVDVTGGEGWVSPVGSWPATGSFLNAVRVRFVAGHAAVPEKLRIAVMMLAGHWYDNRGMEAGMPPAVEALISAHRRMSI